MAETSSPRGNGQTGISESKDHATPAPAEMSASGKELMSAITREFPQSISELTSEGISITYKAKLDVFHDILRFLKLKNGFDHLSDVTCVDYIDEGEFELIYHLWSHPKKIRCNVKVRIPRDSPVTHTVMDIWLGAQMHERENHELFGVKFEGNPDLSPLFLEDWDEIPPFRKDFDTREYVKKELEGD
jgi:NADH-quinone oxidoreductase subunit C